MTAGPQGGQLGLQGRPHGGGEPGRGLHHDVDEERAAGEADLGALPVELVDGLLDVCAVLARTPPRPLSTRSTVASLRPACRAISRSGYGWRLEGFLPAFCRATARPYFYRRAMSTLTETGCRLEDFVEVLAERTDPADYPHATAIEQEVLVYDRDGLLAAPDEELVHALSAGPGIVVIKGAYADVSVVDATTAVFEELMTRQRVEGGGAGDHFATPSASTSGCGTRWRSSR